MEKLSLIFLLITLVCSARAPANSFYVESGSVKKEGSKWTMNLLNHHTRSSQDGDNPELTKAFVTIESLDANVLHLKMVNASGARWEAPIFNPSSGSRYTKVDMEKMGFTYAEEPFSFKITDPVSAETFVDTSGQALEFFDKYLHIGLTYSSKRVFGLGERVTGDFQLCTEREECQYTLFGKDAISPYDDGSGGGKGIYGAQPFYLIQLKKRTHFVGVLFLNSNPNDAWIKPFADESMLLSHKTVGGVFDFYFFYGGSADFVLRKYHDFIGRPYLPPFWTLGFHLCRYGWRTLDKVKEVVQKMAINDIPLDTVWADIDYMKDYGDFTVDPVRFGGLGDFVKEIHSRGMHYVPIIDAGLKYDKKDKYYIKGEENKAFIKSAFTKQTLVGTVWPGPAVYLSYFAPYSEVLWHEGLSDLQEMIAFDGIWLDMNEPANFCGGECPPKTTDGENDDLPTPSLGEEDPHDPKEFDNLPYRVGNGNLNDKTVSMTGYHNSTNYFEDRTRKEFNTHSIFATMEARATYRYFTDKLKKRPFVLTRSNFAGAGLFASKWTGDNFSRWEYMRYSIIGMYNFQLFGMPLVGSDMCGFISDTNEELCGRWMQLGSFYPFSRNHNDIHAKDQEPYVFGERVAMASRNAIRQKYSILRYYFTKLFEVSLNGGSLVQPLFFEFPLDKTAYEKTKFMFLIGGSLLVAPVLYEGLDKTWPYCPNEHWYHLYNRNQVYKYDPTKQEGAQIELPAGFDYINVLVRGGTILPFQDALGSKVKYTNTLKSMAMEMIIAPNKDGKAFGTMASDDPASIFPIDEGKYRYMNFTFSMDSKTLSVGLIHDYGTTEGFEQFNKVSVFGAGAWASVKSACVAQKAGTKTPIPCEYDSVNKVLGCSKASSGINWQDIVSVTFDASC